MPSGNATIAVRGVISSRTGRSENARTPETTAISSVAAHVAVSAGGSPGARVVRAAGWRRGGRGGPREGGDLVRGRHRGPGVLEAPGRCGRATQLVRHPASQLVLAHGCGGDADGRRDTGEHESDEQHDEGDSHRFSNETWVTRRCSTRSTTTR